MYESQRRNPNEAIVRPALFADMTAFKQLRLRALHDHPIAFTADYETHLGADEAFWRNYFNFDGSGMVYFAVHEGNLIGMTGIRLGSSPKTRHSALIWGVYLLPEWRRGGLAERLITVCLDWANASGAVVARLGVVGGNEPALRCYRRCGFEVYGTEPKAVYYDGKFYDELLMSRSL